MNTKPIRFTILPRGKGVGNAMPGQAFLRQDRWDDWGKYQTQFDLIYIDDAGYEQEIGSVKIGQFGMRPAGTISPHTPKHRTPDVPQTFTMLDDSFFSLGQNAEYYGALEKIGDDVRESILRGLRDVAADEALWLQARDEDVMTESLLRGISVAMVEGQLRRMAQGGARVTPYAFSFAPPRRMGDGKPPFELHFDVLPESKPPTNVHVLIGRNGVGKTRLLGLMTKALVAPETTARQSGNFSWNTLLGKENHFVSLVTVSFSAFDNAELLPDRVEEGNLKFAYIGLHRKEDGKSSGRPKSPEMLATEFVKSLGGCQTRARKKRWFAALTVLASDPVFNSANLHELIEHDLDNEEHKRLVLKTFDLLSSGHKIVLLTLTRLVETVEEKTLILIDEPEAHLHPPLLSAFVRALSNLLFDRNGVAIIATHSPVVLQEVPMTCVWFLTRSLKEAKAERPSIETFGENVGILTREVFQLELAQSGFHKLLESAMTEHQFYESAVQSLGGQLGAEARAVLRALYLEKEGQNAG